VKEQIFFFLAAFALTAGSIKLALPALQKWALAMPNERSSHSVPVPQAGGIFVIATTSLLAILAANTIWESGNYLIAAVLIPATAICLVGLADDRFGLSPLLRLFFYTAASFGCVFSLPVGLISLGSGSTFLDRLFAGFFILSFINITNFMDGIDGLVVAEFVPMLSFIAILSGLGIWSLTLDLLPAILAGALLGFFLFNRPKAKIFLGDAGSVAIGFLVGVMLVILAGQTSILVALLLPLYFLADASITLMRRFLRGEKIWHGHRQHFYQQAFDAGQGNWSILFRVFAINLVLCASSIAGGPWALAVAMAAIAWLLFSLRGKYLRG
jgi:UDP-N-acetylmuramyl pentapeptide phosphotransferase/UDP-N-acetylglucosamine-1-phosphate transferase